MREENQEILAGFETLMNQASMTARTYMREAVRSIDAEFGEGFSIKHPELVVGFMQTAASDFLAANVGIAAQKISATIIELIP